MVAEVDRRQILTTVNDRAAAFRLAPGMPLTKARAILPDLAVLQADPAGDLAALRAFGLWAQRFTPAVALTPPDGLALDVTGVTHLFGGEDAFLRLLAERIAAMGVKLRLALGDGAAAAWALARFAPENITIAAPGDNRAVLAPLPIRALRLDGALVSALQRLGLARIGDLYEMPRAALVRRFGEDLAFRLDQALGQAAEALDLLPEPEPIRHMLNFVEPIATPAHLARALEDGVRAICVELDRRQLGLRRLDLCFERLDGSPQRLGIGTARPSRAPEHLLRLLKEKLPALDPGLGVERILFDVHVAEELSPAQDNLLRDEARVAGDHAGLIDRLVNRLGPRAVHGFLPIPSDLPERAVRRIGPLAERAGDWPAPWIRPLRLLNPPEPVETMALLPDYPPVSFTWRRVRRRIRAADGPERVFGEWWRRAEAEDEIRDYYRVEDETGARFWLFRRTMGGEQRWYLHGIFA